MRRTLLLAALFVALGASTSSAQYSNRDQQERRVTEPGVYQDDRGEYQWQTVEHRVWIPERRTSGVFGIGARTIPGHYEMRTDRVKTYRNEQNRNGQYGNGQYGTRAKGWEGKHPHGMPPGQRKKLENRRDNDRDNDRYDRDNRDDRDGRYDNRDDRYDSRSKGKNKGH
jgi:hypothetical protein